MEWIVVEKMIHKSGIRLKKAKTCSRCCAFSVGGYRLECELGFPIRLGKHSKAYPIESYPKPITIKEWAKTYLAIEK